MNIQFGEESDSSDEDYVPTGASAGIGGEVPSEVESDGDPEDPLSGDEESPEKGRKRKKSTKRAKKKVKVEENKEESSDSANCSPEKKELTEEEKKKRTDSIWADFKKDTSFKSKPSAAKEIVNNDLKKAEVKIEDKKVPEKVKITQIFEFAGEEVKIEKEVAVGSAEARLSSTSSTSLPQAPSKGRGRGKGLGGLGSVLNQLGKKQKLSTLEKSKLDWNKFKREEKIEDELESYKKGKDGYLERQDFLQRADLRTFEIEKDVRAVERNKRMNMNNAP